MIYLNLRKIFYFKKLCSFTCLSIIYFKKKLLFTLELKIENFEIHGIQIRNFIKFRKNFLIFQTIILSL